MNLLQKATLVQTIIFHDNMNNLICQHLEKYILPPIEDWPEEPGEVPKRSLRRSIWGCEKTYSNIKFRRFGRDLSAWRRVSKQY